MENCSAVGSVGCNDFHCSVGNVHPVPLVTVWRKTSSNAPGGSFGRTMMWTFCTPHASLVAPSFKLVVTRSLSESELPATLSPLTTKATGIFCSPKLFPQTLLPSEGWR